MKPWDSLTDPGPESKIYGFTFSNTSMVFLSLFYLVVFGASEFTYHNLNPLAGIIFYLIILFSLIVAASVSANQSQRALWLALGLVPLMRIVSSVIPLSSGISHSTWYVLISIPTILGVLGILRIFRVGLREIGLNINNLPVQGLVAVNGLSLSIIDYLILRPAAWTNALTVQSTLFPAFVLLVFTGLTEELVFRGVIRRAFEMVGPYGSVYSAAVYAVLQIGQGSVLHLIFTFLIGLFFGWIVKKTGSILGVGIAHGFINVAMYLFLPYFF
jgi:uncharacterized protein